MMWRLLQDRKVSHSSGLAVDDALAQCALGNSTALRIYTYQPCVLIGRFQHVLDEVHMENCRKLKIPVNRRPTGGGAIIMGPKQLGIAISVPSDSIYSQTKYKCFMQQFSKGIIGAMDFFGIRAEFQGKNDLTVGGRKIAGLGMYSSATGGKLFHASILLDLDIEFMLQVLKTPFQKLADKGLKHVSDRVTTLSREIGPVTASDVQKAIVAGYENAFDTNIVSGNLTEEEVNLANQLQREKYETDQWVFGSQNTVRDEIGHCRLPTPDGTIEVSAIVANQTIKSVTIYGDFIASENAVLDLESRLRWHSRDATQLNQTIQASMEKNDKSWNDMPATLVTKAVITAIDSTGINSPHPCFALERRQ